MSLKTYSRLGEGPHLTWHHDWFDPRLDDGRRFRPGQFVSVQGLGGEGMIVAINDEEVTVLWSVLPYVREISNMGYVYAPYVPLVVTSTIFAPEKFMKKAI